MTASEQGQACGMHVHGSGTGLDDCRCNTRPRTMTDVETAQEWVRIIRGEYLEIPDLQLTWSQVQRLWGLGDVVCAVVLNTLIEDRFLRLTMDFALLHGRRQRIKRFRESKTILLSAS